MKIFEYFKKFTNYINIFKNFNYDKILNFVTTYARKEGIKLFLANVVKITLRGGLQTWVVMFISEYLFDHLVSPLIEVLARKGMLVVDKGTGYIRASKAVKAREEHNESKYDSQIGDI